MKMMPFLACCAGALLAGGCAHPGPNTPLLVDTEQHSPVRLQVYRWPAERPNADESSLRRILMLPPLGIDDDAMRNNLQRHLYDAALRRFATPLVKVSLESAYAPYVCDGNLIRNDGGLNTGEIAYLGALMNCSHVLVPFVREYTPYHPQRIDLRFILVTSGTATVNAELSGVVDVRDNTIFSYFEEYEKTRNGGNKDDLRFEIKSPEAFQAFVADLCGSVMAQRLFL